MPLSVGARLGPYEIVSGIGAGGMGEVYKARDTRLNRTVAIKVLPAETARDPHFRRRFQREARAIAALNHPHICTLHDVGQQDDIDFLVMEHLEGETLASRLDDGPLALSAVQAIGAQIADALEKAHRAGITHRDLKPGNVMLTRSGVKLLDFGLAQERLLERDVGTAGLPTETALTGRGDLLGTPQYMAPELLEGHPADARSDIFAFGCVLYEMVSGRRPFDGSSHATIVAAILRVEPASLITLRPGLPVFLDRIVMSCLVKDPDARAQSIADVRRELLWVSDIALNASSSQPRRAGASRVVWMLLAAGLMALGAMWAVRGPVLLSSTAEPLITRFDVRVENGWQIEGRPAISPDGDRIAYAARLSNDVAATQLFVRERDRVEPLPLEGTVGAAWPFFSPDGQRIGFFHSGGLSMVAVAGGVPILISSTGHLANDATWAGDDHIIFAPTIFSGLRRVPVTGGPIETLLRPDSARGEVGDLFPELLPGDNAALLTITNADSADSSKIAVWAFGEDRTRVLIEGGQHARYASSGHLVYARGATLMAVPFDVQRREVRGTPVEVLAGVRHGDASYFAISKSGTLVYSEGGDETHTSIPVWMAPDAGVIPLANAVVGEYFDPKISPDGRQVAVSIRVGHNQDIWVHDLVRGTWLRLTHDAATDMAPVWVAGGSRIVYSSRAGDSVDLFSVPSDGSGEPTVLYRSDGWKFAGSWSESRQLLAFQESPKGVYGAVGSDLWLLDMSAAPRATVLLRTRFSEGSPAISPNGRWVAYSSDESGRREVYVIPLGGRGRKSRISTDGGQHPRWTPSGGELLYVSRDRVMATTVTAGAVFDAGAPRASVTAKYYGGVSVPNYDVAQDGRLLMMREVPPPPPARRLIVVQNWTQELNRRVPR
jgi:serine/threonine-protein kinase